MHLPNDVEILAEAKRLGLVEEPDTLNDLSTRARAKAAQSILDTAKAEKSASQSAGQQNPQGAPLELISRVVTQTPVGELMVEVWLNPKKEKE